MRPDGVCVRPVAFPTLIRKGRRCLLASTSFPRIESYQRLDQGCTSRCGQRVTIEAIHGSHETVPEFLLRCDADMAKRPSSVARALAISMWTSSGACTGASDAGGFLEGTSSPTPTPTVSLDEELESAHVAMRHVERFPISRRDLRFGCLTTPSRPISPESRRRWSA